MSLIWSDIKSSLFFRPVLVVEAIYNIAKLTPKAAKSANNAVSVGIPKSKMRHLSLIYKFWKMSILNKKYLVHNILHAQMQLQPSLKWIKHNGSTHLHFQSCNFHSTKVPVFYCIMKKFKSLNFYQKFFVVIFNKSRWVWSRLVKKSENKK